MAAEITCKVIQLVCEGFELTTGIIDLAKSEKGNKGIAGVNLAMRVATIACCGVGVGAKIGGASTGTLTKIKGGELVIRSLDMPVKILKAVDDCVEDKISVTEAIEKGFLAPASSILRTTIEHTICQENHYLAMTPEELAKHSRKVIKPGSDFENPEFDVVPVVRAECEKILKDAKKILVPVAATEIALRAGIVSKSAKSVHNSYLRLANQVRGQRQHLRAIGGMGLDVEGRDYYDLLNHPKIPELLHRDPVFQRYICGITYEPTRHPVGVPDYPSVVFERATLLSHIRNRGTNPMNNTPLTIDQIIEKPALQAVIDSRLRFHEERMRAALAVDEDPALLAAAVAESPYLHNNN